jgi:hypothetical protein
MQGFMTDLAHSELADDAGRAGPAAADYILDTWYVAAVASEVPSGGKLDLQICGRAVRLSRNRDALRAEAGDGGGPLPCVLSEGLAWVFVESGRKPEGAALPPVPVFGGPKGRVRFVEKVVIPATQDDAAYGLLDPAHTPFVHRSPIWRGNGILKLKTKPFEPSEMGFTMMPHAPVNSDIYKIIGGAISVRIAFRLPGLRAEYISNSRHTVLGLSALTPIDARHTALRQIFYWNSPVLNLVRPFARLFARPFLQQDVDIMALRRANEAFGGKGMLIGGSDQQFLWYLQLKKAWAASGHDPARFENPLKPATLHWKT